MAKQEFIQCCFCGSPNVKCLDGSDMENGNVTVDICPDMYLCDDCGETFRLDEIGNMMLEITEIAWGINRVTGEKSESVSGRKCFRCKIGELPRVGVSGRRFTIDKVNEKSVVLSVHTAIAKHDKTWMVKKGETVTYKPLSYDGGHYYQIKLK